VLRSDLELICASLRDCVHELNAILEILEAACDHEDNATRIAYSQLVKQLTMRQSELEKLIQRQREAEPSRATVDIDKLEVVLRQLEKSARVISRNLQERFGGDRRSYDSKCNDALDEK
jgi:CCR4-NOT transcriptional regulation complex NOT5 subunit